ncbi:hypothetical protein [Sphingobacterium hungaricum]
MPTTYPYTNGEYNLNLTNVEAAATKITGGDAVDSKVFWDVR